MMALPVRSAMSVLLSAPGAQSSAAAMLYVVPCVDDVPFLLSRELRLFWSVLLRVMLAAVADVSSTSLEVRV